MLVTHARATVCVVMAVPESWTDSGEFAALLAMATEPETLPEVVGANATFRLALWLGDNTNPAFTPESEKPLPVTFTDEIVILEFPVFFSETVCEVLAFSLTLPKDTVDGLTLREYVAAAPVPVSATVDAELDALLASEIEPEELDAVVGENFTLNDADWPACTVSGVVSPETLKPAPVAV